MTNVYATLFTALCRQHGLPQPVPEFRFHATRKWRFDFAWPEHRLALEVDGAIWTRGRHSRGSGIVAEHEKFNAAASEGWRVLRTQPRTLATLATIALVKQSLATGQHSQNTNHSSPQSSV